MRRLKAFCCAEHRVNTGDGTHPDWPCLCRCTLDCTRPAERNKGGEPLAKQEVGKSLGTDAYRAARAYAVTQREVSPAIQERLVSAFMQGAIWLQEWDIRKMVKEKTKHGKRKS